MKSPETVVRMANLIRRIDDVLNASRTSKEKAWMNLFFEARIRQNEEQRAG